MGTWIEISFHCDDNDRCVRRSLRGNVDRNGVVSPDARLQRPVVPYVGTWIEIQLVDI